MTLAIDISNYSGPLTAEQAQALVAAGVRRVIVQLVSPNILLHQQQIPVLKAAGIEVEGYVYLWMRDDVKARVRWASIECALYGVPFLWLDVEDETPGITTDIAQAAVLTAMFNCVIPYGIYTSASEWQRLTGGSTIAQENLLWDAHYDGVPALAPVAYGGWSKAAMKQYAANATVAGIPNVDLNYYEGATVAVFNKADNQAQAAEQLVAAANHASAEVAAAQGDGVYVFQSGPLADEAGNTITIAPGKVGTLLIHDA